jgi:hypothetical protein
MTPELIASSLDAALPRFATSHDVLGRVSRGDPMSDRQTQAAVFQLGSLLGLTFGATSKHRPLLVAEIERRARRTVCTS